MITKVTKENSKLYRDLFDKAEAVLNEGDPVTPVAIHSLDEYFACFQDLAANKNHLFKMLPLDEPTFDIDANTRDIFVPEVFRKNGVGVQGDQLAETLFFTIDRYFDTTDLYSDDIKGIVQWESAPKGKQFETGYSPIAFKDVTIVKNKMVFGWFLNNIITSNPGTVKFSVRFFSTTRDTNENNKDLLKLNFSLSTKTQSITINPAISYDINTESGMPEVNDYNDLHLVTNRFKDSVYVGEADSAEEPVFTNKEFGGIFNFQNIKSVPVVENGIVVNTAHISDLENGKLTLLTQAISTDAGKISYFWKEKELNSKNAFDLDTARPIYVETEDLEVKADKDYYVKVNANGSEGYQKATDLEVGQLLPKDSESILYYELFNGVEINSTGDYWVEAKNRHGVATTSVKSEIVRIPGPGVLEVESPSINKNFLDEEGKITLTVNASTDQEGDAIHYSWIDIDTASILGNENSWSLDAVTEEEAPYFDKEVKVSIYAERNGDKTESIERSMRITAEPQIPVVTVEKDYHKISYTAAVKLAVEVNKDIENPAISDGYTYQWYWQTYDEADDDIKIEGANGAEYVLAHNAEHPDGVFYCEVTNHLNGGSISVDSPEITVIRN